MSDLQIAMRAAKIDHIRATRRFGAFAVLTLRTIEKIRAGRITASEAARHFEQMARSHQLRETGHYDPRLVDILITRVRQASRLLTKLSVFLTERHTKNRQRYGARTTLGRVLPPSYTPAHAPGLALFMPVNLSLPGAIVSIRHFLCGKDQNPAANAHACLGHRPMDRFAFLVLPLRNAFVGVGLQLALHRRGRILEGIVIGASGLHRIIHQPRVSNRVDPSAFRLAMSRQDLGQC